MKKKGISPVIATILLVAIVVILAVLIFFWFRSLVQERVTKFGDENIQLACNKVDFEVSYSSNRLVISNKGNVPIKSMKIQKIDGKNYITEDLDWPQKGLNEGLVHNITINLGGYEEIRLIPVLLGLDEKGNEVIYNCDEKKGKLVRI